MTDHDVIIGLVAFDVLLIILFILAAIALSQDREEDAPVKTDPRAAAMSEADLQESVRQHCASLGLFHYHPWSSVRSEPGWPDSVIIGRKVLFRELKTEYGKLSPAQVKVSYLLRAAGANWKVWRPSDLFSGLIAAELTEVAGVQAELFSIA